MERLHPDTAKLNVSSVMLALSGLAFASSTLAAGQGAQGCSKFNIDPQATQSLHAVTLPPKAPCVTHLSNGYPLPDPSCTPGAINPTVTQTVLQTKGYTTRCVRNNVSTETQKAATYSWYNIPHPKNNVGPTQTCELDHLVSLELGGADSLDNIWPQCGPDKVTLYKRYFKQKDVVENFLAAQVKANKMKLEDAQQGIASDWTQYLKEATKQCGTKGKCK